MAEFNLGYVSRFLSPKSASGSLDASHGGDVLLGDLDNTTIIGGSNLSDTYSFYSTSNYNNLNLSLTGLTDDADLRLYRDSNNNGIIDSSDPLVGTSRRFGSSDESITVSQTKQYVDRGNFLVEVEAQRKAKTPYTLTVSATNNTDPSNLLPTEVDLEGFDRISKSGSVHQSDTTDTFRFRVGFRNNFRFNLSGSGDTDVRLVHDINKNGQVDSNEEIARSETLGTSSESLSKFLATGEDYFIQVYAGNNQFNSYSFDARLI